MDISFSIAKNNSKTCSLNGKALHSSYNPEKEAERFVSQLEIDYIPEYIIILAPALSYCAAYLRKRFPEAKLIAIHFSKQFTDTDFNWDNILYIENTIDFSIASKFLEDKLFSIMGEEGIAKSFFASWPASAAILKDEINLLWESIKNVVLKSRDIIGTRNYFSLRWISNSLRFFTQAKKIYGLKKISKPIIVAASGPSLKGVIEALRKYRDRFYLIAVSSALKPLLYEEIIPDLCISTDGGYWAKKHLEPLLKEKNIPLAVSAEAAIPGKILEQNPIVPLVYGDGPEAKLFEECNIKAFKAYRNGTVSGTAVQLALMLSDSHIYCCGLDLSTAKGFQHTQPNELENINCIADYKLSNKITRLTSSEQHSGSLDIYRNWFCSRDKAFASRVSRFSTSNLKQLGNIEDINVNLCEKILSHFPENKEKSGNAIIELTVADNIETRKEKIKAKIKALCNISDLNFSSEEIRIWLKNAVPSACIHYEKYKTEEAYKELKDAAKAFFIKLSRSLKI